MAANLQLPPPKSMICNKGDAELNWKEFKEAYTDYVVATKINKEEKPVQSATLKTVMGAECRKVLRNLKLTDDKLKDPAEIIKALDDKFLQTHIILFERYQFYLATQQPNQSVEQFFDCLRQLVIPCQFGDQEEDMLRDRLVLGTKDHEARARLFRQKQKEVCNLKSAIETLKISKVTKQQMEAMSPQNESLHSTKFSSKRNRRKKKPSEKPARRDKESKNPGSRKKKCKYCGGKHERQMKKCPAYGHKCQQCGKKKNHFKAVCRDNPVQLGR